MTAPKNSSADSPLRLWQDNRKLRFLVAGGWNTLFGYLCFYILYLLLADRLHYLAIAVIAHFVAAVQSYAVQRRLVFHSTAPVVGEFLRFNASLVGTLLFGLLAMYLLVEIAALSPPIAQGIVILGSVALSYVLHSRVSFIPRTDRQGPRS